MGFSSTVGRSAIWVAGSAILVSSLAMADEWEVRGQAFDHGDPTPNEQLMLEMMNRARANPGAEAARLGIDLNQGLPADTIEDTPKPPLAFHPLLTEAARKHSVWMLATDTFTHAGAGGSTAQQRMIAEGYVFSGLWTYGENISWTGTSGTPDPTAFTIDRHESLFRSPLHRKNICNGPFEEVGLGVVEGEFKGFNALMVTQDFATSDFTPGPLLTGVLFADADGDHFYDPGEGVPNVMVAPAEGDWHAISSSSGGFALPYQGNSGTIRVHISGSPFAEDLTLEIQKTGRNVKLDVNFADLAQISFQNGSITFSETHGFAASVTGTPGTAFRLQHSTNLATWSTVGSYQLGVNVLPVSHLPAAPADGRHFYRLRWDR